MARRIPDETLHTIRDRISIVEVVSAYVSLKRTGRNHTGLCPFHSEKTPSFTVSDERGLFHCFGCGESGTVFTFLMKMERLEFLDAVAQLAARAGVALPKAEDDPAAARREALYAANAAAARFFAEALAGGAGAAARRYLARRGLRDEIMTRYGLGFAPAGGGVLAAWLDRQKIPREIALQAGLLGRSDDGRVYDRFRGRVMFPIRDRRGRTIAFGGRALGEEQPKYLNSPETPLFRKGEGLYGVAEARDAARAADRIVLVEGYMDALVLVQEGVPYTIATLGTALTAAQLRLLRPLGGEQLAVFFFFDGDRAGRQAAVRAFAVCAEAGVWGRAAFLPDGYDPDSYTRERGAAATLASLDAARPLVDVYFDALLPAGATLPQRSHAADEVKRILGRVQNEVHHALLVRQAAQRLGLGEEVFGRTRPGPVAGAAAQPARRPAWPPRELSLVQLAVADEQVGRWVVEHGALEVFQSAELAAVARATGEAWRTGRPVADVVEPLPEALRTALASAALGGESWIEASEDRVATAGDLAQRIRVSAQRAQRRVIHGELAEAERSGDDTWREKLATLNDAVRRGEGGAG